MKKNALILILIIGFLFIAIIAGFSTNFSEAAIDESNELSFAVVELFTSEGCSSCPPAGKLLHNIIEDARENNKRIFALAFHVDYWNYLGWKDIYGKAAHSQRQQRYARLLHSNVYTPQIVINGKAEMVGSNRSKVLKHIEGALQNRKDISLTLDLMLDDKKCKVNVNYQLNKLSPGTKLNIVLAERGLSRHIKNGENSGRILEHENVVRVFKTVSKQNKMDSIELDFPDDVEISHSSIIAYLQDTHSGKIMAAQGRDL